MICRRGHFARVAAIISIAESFLAKILVTAQIADEEADQWLRVKSVRIQHVTVRSTMVKNTAAIIATICGS